MRKSILMMTTGLLLCGVVHTPLRAQAMTLTLADAISRAQQQAPTMIAAEAALRVADANTEVMALRPNHTLSYEVENVLGSGRYANFGSNERTLKFAIPIELGGKRDARRRVAEAERNASQLDLNTTRADLVQRVRPLRPCPNPTNTSKQRRDAAIALLSSTSNCNRKACCQPPSRSQW